MGRLRQAELRQRIPRSFDAFFDRFPRLLPIQRDAIEPLADGRDVLLAAPTAGGKTEAAVAPLLGRILSLAGRGVEGPALLYIVPTRALVNDVYRRITVPLERLGLTLGRKTADHQSLGKRMPQLLVTTPESLDSMLARAPRRLLPVQAIVLDELHALDGSPRGDQLAALCVRLRRILSSRRLVPQVAMLSATIDRPAEMAARYARGAVILRDRRRRRMAARIASSPYSESPAPSLSRLVEGQGGKVLVFANSRSDVEWAAGTLRGLMPFGEAVFAHHGSLSKELRERAERDFASAKLAVCFATSTLELGIDIGNVDFVVLYGVPPDLPSLLQRVGRAGRRSEKLHFLALARDRGETLRFRHMVKVAREGRLLTDAPVYDPGTALQQSASLLFQNPSRAIAPAHVLDRLPDWQQRWWSEERLERALEHAGKLFHRVTRGHYRASEELERKFRTGSMHSNIGSEAEVEVIEELTGRSLGTVSGELKQEGLVDLGRPDPGREADPVLLAGNPRSLWERADGRIVAGVSPGHRGEARFKAKPAPPVPGALARDLVSWLGLDGDQIHRVETEDETFFLIGLGSVSGYVLHAAAGEQRVRPRPGRGVAFGLRFRGGHADWPAEIAQAERLRIVARGLVSRLTRLLGYGPFFASLPEDERERAVLDAVDTEGLARRLRSADVLELHDDALRRKVRQLLAP
ncbi:MAG: DEAD/DEAH box helicase [Planctomycetota bacterium]